MSTLLKGQPLFKLTPPPVESDGSQGANDFLVITDISGNVLLTIDYQGNIIRAGQIVTVSAAYTVPNISAGAAIETVIVSGTTTVTLPAASDSPGRKITVKNVDASLTATIASGGGTIDGGTTKTLTAQYKYATVQSDGTNWFIVANN